MALRFFFLPFNNIDSFFQSRVLSKYTVYAQLMSLVSTCILGVAFRLHHKPLLYFAFIIVSESGGRGRGLCIFLPPRAHRPLEF